MEPDADEIEARGVMNELRRLAGMFEAREVMSELRKRAEQFQQKYGEDYRMLTTKELDELGCSNPDCMEDHRVLFFEPACHEGAGLTVFYEKTPNRRLLFQCAVCGKVVGAVAVSESRPERLTGGGSPQKAGRLLLREPASRYPF